MILRCVDGALMLNLPTAAASYTLFTLLEQWKISTGLCSCKDPARFRP